MTRRARSPGSSSARRSWCASPRRARARRCSTSAPMKPTMRPEIAARPFMFREGQVHLRPLGSPDPDPLAARRPARRLRRAAPEGLGHRPRAVSPRKGHLDRRDVPVGASSGCWAIGSRARRLRRPVRLGGLRRLHRGRARHRPRAARAVLLHPHAAELDVVDGARRVSADRARARSAALWIAAGSSGWDGGDQRLAPLRRARGVWRDGLHGPALRAGPRARPVAGSARDDRSAGAGGRRGQRRAAARLARERRRSGDARRLGWTMAWGRSRTWRFWPSSISPCPARRCTTNWRCARFATAPGGACSGSARSAAVASRPSCWSLVVGAWARRPGSSRSPRSSPWRQPRLGGHLGRGRPSGAGELR